MDNLSKLAFLSSGIILDKLTKEQKENLALVFANSSSCLDTDIKHQQSIENQDEYFPSPAIFVYTLPNICLGEISIRHQLHTESSFFIFDEFPLDFFEKYSETLCKTTKTNTVLCGWVDILDNQYEALVYLKEF
ncbi:MAG: 3-oxoacyl-ACP synthase [Capnocytophaga sp.]|nr:3-oxoacyl-ACP synthase [Capnocytophaga sp.]